MKKRNVIKDSNLKTRNPLFLGLVSYLVLDRFNAPEWVQGAIGSIFGLIFIIFIIDLFKTNEVDIFADDSVETEQKKKSFKERVQDKINS